jgi:hypothetical protein
MNEGISDFPFSIFDLAPANAEERELAMIADTRKVHTKPKIHQRGSLNRKSQI